MPTSDGAAHLVPSRGNSGRPEPGADSGGPPRSAPQRESARGGPLLELSDGPASSQTPPAAWPDHDADRGCLWRRVLPQCNNGAKPWPPRSDPPGGTMNWGGIRGKRFTIEGGLCFNGFLAYMIQEGPMNSNDYNYFIEHILVIIILHTVTITI